jgi:hypothetical protein
MQILFEIDQAVLFNNKSMFCIIDDVTIKFAENELFLTLMQDGDNFTIEITNRKCRIVNIQIPNLEQGRRVMNQILPSLKKIKCYYEAVDLLSTEFIYKHYKEAAFIVRVYKTILTFKDLDLLSKIFHIKTKIHCGQITINEVEYDLSYSVFWRDNPKPIGCFVGFFDKGFIFIKT